MLEGILNSNDIFINKLGVVKEEPVYMLRSMLCITWDARRICRF